MIGVTGVNFRQQNTVTLDGSCGGLRNSYRRLAHPGHPRAAVPPLSVPTNTLD